MQKNPEKKKSTKNVLSKPDPEVKPPKLANTLNDKEDELKPVTQVLCKKKLSKSSVEINQKENFSPARKETRNKNANVNLITKNVKHDVTTCREKQQNNTKSEESCSSPSPEISYAKQATGDVYFQLWKSKKNITYRRIFEEEKRKLHEEQEEAKMKEVEQKFRARQALCRWRKQHERGRMLEAKKADENSSVEEEKEIKRKRSEEAYKAWKAKKDLELRKRNKQLMEYQKYYAAWMEENGKTVETHKPNVRREFPYLNFDTWLNQLDQVLHEKYLRERRYRTRSFYCQPAYFGEAAKSQRFF